MATKSSLLSRVWRFSPSESTWLSEYERCTNQTVLHAAYSVLQNAGSAVK